jgi:hypothetical protein
MKGGRGNVWEGPTDEQWSEILNRTSGYNFGARNYISKKLGISYDTFLRWRERNPEKDAEFRTALRARAERYMFDLEGIADNVDDDGNPKADNPVIQGRNKIQIDFRLNYLKAFNNDFKPKQDINVTGLTDDELRKQLESEIAALVGRSEETRDNPS